MISKNVKFFFISALMLGSFAACNDTKDALGLPVISSIDPDAGSEDGGKIVTITGENLDEDVKVEIGGVDCKFETFTSDKKVSCITGAKEVDADTEYNVVVTNPNGDSDTLKKGFSYTND